MAKNKTILIACPLLPNLRFFFTRKLFSKKIHSRGKDSKHYTSRVVYILSFSPYPASLSLIINKNTQQDTTKILNKMPQKCAMIW